MVLKLLPGEYVDEDTGNPAETFLIDRKMMGFLAPVMEAGNTAPLFAKSLMEGARVWPFRVLRANLVAEETLHLAKQAMKLDFGKRSVRWV